MAQPRCIITGCTLFMEAYNRSVHGDLHMVGNTYVFNACLGEDGESFWNYDPKPLDELRQCALIVDGGFFERRGVIVIDNYDARLNTAAINYISGAHHG